MESDLPKPRFLRRLFSWKTLRRALIGLAALITLLIAFVTEENWRGRHDWEKYKAEQEAKGEHFDMAFFIPKLPPPDQNFAMTPFLAPLQDYKMVNGELQWNNSNPMVKMSAVSLEGVGDYPQDSPSMGDWRRGKFCDLAKWQSFYRNNTNFPSNPNPQTPALDVLFALNKFQPVFSELRAASERPYAVFPFYYDPQLDEMVLFVECKRLVRLTSLRAIAELDANQNAEALKDVKLCLSLSKLLQHEPLLISQFVRLAVIEISIQPIWEGLARHRWTDGQLQQVQKALAEIQPLDDYASAMRGERAFGNEELAKLRAGHVPAMGLDIGLFGRFRTQAMLYHNQVALNRLMEGFTLAAVDGPQHRVFPKRCDTNVIVTILSKPKLYNVLAWMEGPALAKAPERFARVQTSIDLATVATALERYHLAHGEYPEDLTALAPQFVEKLPNDVITGEPLKYRRTQDGQFILYSVGWNETDDGGKVVLKSNSNGIVDPEKGDWVWQYPPK